VLSVYNRGTAAFDRSWQLLDAVPAIREPDLPEPLPDNGDIVFDRVSLVHDDGTRALEDISLRIRAGSTVALVGPTGSGKTTLVELIPRLRDPTSGEVRFGDVPLPRAPLARLRERMSYAPQEGFLFSMTLDENIRYADPDDSDRARRDRAVAIAHLTPDLAALPAGLDTVVGERGVTVSGGQRHRTTIARAIYARADVLLLDDALASVDTETERAILENLRDVLADRTCVLVTHRFNALDLVDEIFVLEDGRLVEHGDHPTLMAKQGRYAELVEQQRLEREFDDAT
jgi:ATP-binding cassette, subfamily B, multidrug efflux pump